ncbi:SLC18B1 [Bugula neritina]|uniref:SLC18B1 n=1 Tax=Bugula neritina TaxID=10212 RepID=A0A7J7KAB9_BUGNE|nr:SLC18B1 [Bugula neritina]
MMDPSSSSEGTLLLPTESPGSIQSDLSHPEVTSANTDNKVKWTKRQIFIAATLSLMSLAQAVASGIIAPFYPSDAAKKGANSTVVGLVFGVYQLVIFVTSPIYGSIIQKVGAKYMYLSGSFILGGCGLAFGFLDRVPDGPVYIAMCFICRSIEANGAAMMMTAAYSIMAATFPHDVGKAIVGGFLLPFEVIGGFVWSCSVISYFTLPKIEKLQQLNVNIFTLLKIPECSVLYISMVSCGMSLSYLGPIFSPYMKATFPNISIPQIGLLFTIASGIYALLAPVMGYISDKGLEGSLAVIGSLSLQQDFSYLDPILGWQSLSLSAYLKQL